MQNYYSPTTKSNNYNQCDSPYFQGTPREKASLHQSKCFNEQFPKAAPTNKNQLLTYNQTSCPTSKSCKKFPPKKKKKFTFKCLKDDTCKSLDDVENFLCNFSCFIKYIKLYNLLK